MMLFIALTVMLATPSPDVPAPDCSFNVTSQVSAPPEVLGPRDVVSRVRIRQQPDSPLRILRVDLRGTKVYRNDGVLEVERVVAIHVQNVSDRTVNEAAFDVAVRTADGATSGGPVLADPLPPGKAVRLKARASRGRLITWREDTPFEIVVGVADVDEESCSAGSAGLAAGSSAGRQ